MSRASPRSLGHRLGPDVRGVLLLLAVAAAATSVVLEPTARESPSVAVLEVLVIVGFATAGHLLGQDPGQRTNGRLLIASAVLQVITHLHLVPHSPLPMLAWLAGPLSAMPASVVLLRFPQSRLDQLAWRWVRFHLTFLVVSRLTFVVPASERRLGWWPAIPMSPSTAATASVIGNSLLAASTLFFAGLLIRRIRANRGLTARHEVLPILVAAVSAAVTVVLHLGSVATGRTGVPTWVLLIEQFALMSVPAAFLFSAVVMRVARAAAGDLLLRVDLATDRQALQHALAETLSDPGLLLLLPDGSGAGWVDTNGAMTRPMTSNTQLEVPVVGTDGLQLALIRVDAATARHRAHLQATVMAAALVLRDIAVLDDMKSLVEETKALNARISEAGYVERRRIERDLHDGAQQRLVGIGLLLDRLRHSNLDEPARIILNEAATQLGVGTQELRDLARGTYPAVLTEHGLLAAVESAADRLGLDVIFKIPDRRWPLGKELVAYFLICEALTNVAKHAECPQAAVEVADDGLALTVVVTDAGRGGAVVAPRSGLAGLVDRVQAAGGSMNVDSPKGAGTCITAILKYG